MLTYYYARGRRVEVERDEGILAMPPKRFATSLAFRVARGLSRASPSPEQLTGVEAHLRDGWEFSRPGTFFPVAATDRLRRYGILRHSNDAVGVLTGCITLRMEPDADVQEVLERYRLTRVHDFGFARGLYLSQGAPAADPVEKANEIREHPRVLWAEPELREPIKRFQQQQPDPLVESQPQWTAVDAAAAWGMGAVGSGVTIAIIDQGCLLAHSDLGPPFGPVGFFQDGSDAQTIFHRTENGFPARSHGTFCAGMAVARANGHGGSGIAPGARLGVVGLRHDTFSQEVMARALGFLVTPSLEGGSDVVTADVISCSIDISLPMRSVLQLALEATQRGRGGRGTPVFWAVDNSATPIPEDGVCSAPEVIAVGSSNGNTGPDTCGFGPQLEFLAPGREVFSTSGDGRYGKHSGTSFATPLAAGIAALMLGVNREFTATELRQAMRRCCTPFGGGGRSDTAGHGVLNAGAAVRLAQRALSE